VDFLKAEAMKLSLSSEHSGVGQKNEIEKALNKTLNVWANGVELALAEFSKLDHLPHQILLCGGGSSLAMLMERLEKGDWHKNLPFTKKPVIKHIQPDEVVGITDTTGDVKDHTFITAMGLLRVGMDTLNSGSAVADKSIKDRINKVLRV
jgi:cell division protein FtsA